QAPAADTDFEARVAAALASYNHPEPGAAAAETHPVETASARHVPEIPTYEPPVAAEPAPSAVQPTEADPAPAPEPEPPAAFEYRPPVGPPQHEPHPELEPEPLDPDFAVAHEPEPVAALAPSPVATVHEGTVQTASSSIEESVAQATHELAAAAAAESESGRDNIAQAGHRVMGRLKPELVNEMIRELKPKE